MMAAVSADGRARKGTAGAIRPGPAQSWEADAPGCGASGVVATGEGDAERAARAWRAARGEIGTFTRGLAGAFAIGIHDRERGRLVLVRDRLGERPLYYAAGADRAAFASDLRTLRALGAPRALLPEAIDA